MSLEIISAVRRRKVGSPTSKSVMMYLADCASDDGTGVWASKANIALDLELSKRTVQLCVQELISKGLISEIGHRKCANGYTVEYRINIDAVLRLPSTRPEKAKATETDRSKYTKQTSARDAPVQEIHPTREAAAPQDVQELHPNLQRTFKEPIVRDEREQANPQFEKFWELYPRVRDKSRSRQLFDEAVRNGVDPGQIVSAAKIYRDEQRGNQRMYLVYSDNWLTERRWEDFAEKSKPTSTSGATGSSLAGQAAFWARVINAGEYAPQSAINPAHVREMLERGLVEQEELRRRGLN